MVDFKKDSACEPNDENLRLVLGDSFPAYASLRDGLAEFGAELAWRFYRDGGWLAKATRKKTTIFWGHAQAGRFTAAFHFNERTRAGVSALDIAEQTKRAFARAPLKGGRLATLSVEIYSEDDLPDVLRLIAYKISAK